MMWRGEVIGRKPEQGEGGGSISTQNSGRNGQGRSGGCRGGSVGQFTSTESQRGPVLVRAMCDLGDAST